MMIVIRSEHMPPSTNAMFRNAGSRDNKRGRIKTERYRTWLQAFGWDVRQQVGANRIAGPYTISIIIDRTKRHKLADLGNYEKGLSDSLVELNVIDDDRFCERIELAYGDVPGFAVQVEIEAAA